MLDPLVVAAAAAAVLTAFSLVLARVAPDRYDDLKLKAVRVRAPRR
jgi:hypothetical protein